MNLRDGRPADDKHSMALERDSLAFIPPPSEETDGRMADLAAFADGLVHDLRNPLNVIRTNVYLLRQKLADTDVDPKAARAVERIDDQVTVAMQLLDGVGAFYRAERPTFQPVQLNEIVAEVTQKAQPPDGCALRSQPEAGLPEALVDRPLIEAALRALIRNAFEAMPQGGSVVVRTCADDKRVRVVVEDAGPGMAEEVRKRALEPFFTTRKAHAGLGLALADRVARAHQGRAIVESTPGAGSRITLELPATASA
jgi:signal transduction histidine kinase